MPPEGFVACSLAIPSCREIVGKCRAIRLRRGAGGRALIAVVLMSGKRIVMDESER